MTGDDTLLGEGGYENSRRLLRRKAATVNARWVETDPPGKASDVHTWECLTCKEQWRQRSSNLGAQGKAGKCRCHLPGSSDYAPVIDPSVPRVPFTSPSESSSAPSSEAQPSPSDVGSAACGVQLPPNTLDELESAAVEVLPTSPALAATPVALPQGQWELHAHGRIDPANDTTRLPGHVRLLLWRGTHHLFQGPTWRSYEALAASNIDAQGCIAAMDDITTDRDWVVFDYGCIAPNVHFGSDTGVEHLLFKRPLRVSIGEGDDLPHMSFMARGAIRALVMRARGNSNSWHWPTPSISDLTDARLHVEHPDVHYFTPVVKQVAGRPKQTWPLDVAGAKVSTLADLLPLFDGRGATTLVLHTCTTGTWPADVVPV